MARVDRFISRDTHVQRNVINFYAQSGLLRADFRQTECLLGDEQRVENGQSRPFLDVGCAHMTYVSGWREGSVAGCLSALKDARGSADRGSLLRTLAWLKGGRLDLISEGIQLLPSHEAEQIRFGYSLPSSATAVSLRDRDGPECWPDLSVDPSERRGLRTGSPDAAPLRLTDLKTYRTESSDPGASEPSTRFFSSFQSRFGRRAIMHPRAPLSHGGGHYRSPSTPGSASTLDAYPATA
jgi:hypothetical protein